MKRYYPKSTHRALVIALRLMLKRYTRRRLKGGQVWLRKTPR